MRSANNNTSVPSVVYHYCSLDSFMAIMKSSTLRLTNIAKSNDSEEIRYCSYMLYRTLQQTCHEFASQLPSEEGEIKEAIRRIEFEKLVNRAVLNESLVDNV